MNAQIKEARLQNVRLRHQRIRDRVNELYNEKVNGMRFQYEDIIEKVAQEAGLATRTVYNILKS